MAVEIPLTQGFVAIVDNDDADLVAQYKWRLHRAKSGLVYAMSRCGGTNAVMMHRLIRGMGTSCHIDHRDGNGLNNQKDNLRLCTHGENMRNRKKGTNNTSGFKGVYRGNSGYRAQIRAKGKKVCLGTFATAVEAALAYNAAAIRLHGEFARTNPI